MKRALLTIALFSCADPVEDDCQPPDGAYEFTFSERTGDCGDQSSVIRFDAGEGIGGDNDECDADVRKSDDGCFIDFEQRCEIHDDDTGELLGEFSTIGTLEIAPDGSSISGVWEVVFANADGERECRGVGDVTYDRL